jgi:hypothetical protein
VQRSALGVGISVQALTLTRSRVFGVHAFAIR